MKTPLSSNYHSKSEDEEFSSHASSGGIPDIEDLQMHSSHYYRLHDTEWFLLPKEEVPEDDMDFLFSHRGRRRSALISDEAAVEATPADVERIKRRK